MAVLPSLNALLRPINGGIANTFPVVQHLTLWVAFVGAMIASAKGKLLSLSIATDQFSQKTKSKTQFFTTTISIFVFFLLAIASWNLVISEKEFSRAFAYGLPVWSAMLVMPAGFLVMAIRTIKHNLRTEKRILFSMFFAIFLFLVLWFFGWEETFFVWIIFVSVIAALLLGAPIVVVLGAIPLLFFAKDGTPLSSIPAETYRIVVSPTLPAIPLFTLAGYILAEGGANKRFISLFRAWLGWLPGGVPAITIIVCAFFTAFTGGSGITILALGGLLYPMLRMEKYSEKFSLGLITSAGSLGMLFPPSLPVILYGVISHTNIKHLFIGGIIPGIILLLPMFIWGYWNGRSVQKVRAKFCFKNAFLATRKAFLETLIPVFIMVFYFKGWATLVEIAAITAVYTFVVEVLIHKDLSFAQLWKVITESITVIGGVLIIVGVAMGLTTYLVDAQIPFYVMEWVQDHINSKIIFLLALNVLLLVVGMLMDVFTALMVVVPLIVPLGEIFGVDPVHLGIIFLANLELGFLTPPVGMNLFLSSYRFNKPVAEIYKSSFAPLIIRVFGVLVVTYAPALSTFLPNVFQR